MKYILIILLCLSITSGYSQTASSLANYSYVADENDSLPRMVSLANPWLQTGAKLAYALNSNANFKDNILFTVRFRKNLYQNDKFTLPLVSNISIENWINAGRDLNSIMGDHGISLGLYPYFIIRKGDINIVPHFEVSARILPSGSLDASRKLYRVSGNIELHMPKPDGEKNTISIGLFYSSNENILEENTYGLDITGIMSIDTKSALLIDYKKSFSGNSLFSMGLIVKTF
jgi:hypothetical protein